MAVEVIVVATLMGALGELDLPHREPASGL